MEEKIKFDGGNKWDLQLSDALIDERGLAKIFQYGTIKKIELKTESWLWERTGNICIEYRRNGKPSGIAVTEATYWVHELVGKDRETYCYFMFPINRLKALCRKAYREGHYHECGGDGGLSDNILIPLEWVIDPLAYQFPEQKMTPLSDH